MSGSYWGWRLGLAGSVRTIATPGMRSLGLLMEVTFIAEECSCITSLVTEHALQQPETSHQTCHAKGLPALMLQPLQS